MKKMILVASLVAMSSIAQAELHYESAAMLVQSLNQTQLNKEVMHSGPTASISAMTSLGFAVYDISASKENDNFCNIKVDMKRGYEYSGYSFKFITETGFAQSAAAKEGKKYSNFSESYRDAVNVCTTMTKTK